MRASRFTAALVLLLRIAAAQSDLFEHSLLGSPDTGAPFEALAFSSDGVAIAVGTRNGQVLLADLPAIAGFRQAAKLPARVVGVSFSLDNTQLVAASEDGSAEVIGLAKDAPFHRAIHVKGRIRAIEMSPDGGVVAISTTDGAIRLLDSAPVTNSAPSNDGTGKPFTVLPSFRAAHSLALLKTAASSNGTRRTKPS